MRVRDRLSSAQSGRGVLTATLFALVIGGLVFAFGAVEAPDPITTAAAGSSDADLVVGLRPESIEIADGVSPARPAAPAAAEPTSDPEVLDAAVFEGAISGLTGRIAGPDTLVLSSPPPPSDPAPPTTMPTTTASPTTDVDSITAPTVTDGSETTSTTTAESTTTEATATDTGPEGWVDAGNGVYVPAVLLAIRFCESTDNYQAANPYSSARGAYQFLTTSWEWYGHAERYAVAQAHLATPAQQDEAALITWEKDGTTPWNASRSCWG